MLCPVISIISRLIVSVPPCLIFLIFFWKVLSWLSARSDRVAHERKIFRYAQYIYIYHHFPYIHSLIQLQFARFVTTTYIQRVALGIFKSKQNYSSILGILRTKNIVPAWCLHFSFLLKYSICFPFWTPLPHFFPFWTPLAEIKWKIPGNMCAKVCRKFIYSQVDSEEKFYWKGGGGSSLGIPQNLPLNISLLFCSYPHNIILHIFMSTFMYQS